MKRRLLLAGLAVFFSLGSSLLLAAAGCTHRGGDTTRGFSPDCDPRRSEYDLSLNRGDWRVGDEKGVWKVKMETSPTKAPEHVGYVVLRMYRELRGGPAFGMYEVTTLNRNDQIGQIDAMGNATRFAPRRGGGMDEVKVGSSTLALNVAAIFQTSHMITLEATSERRLAFEAFDTNHDGGLDKTEYPRILDSDSPDTNHDGKIDPQEFDAIDHL